MALRKLFKETKEDYFKGNSFLLGKFRNLFPLKPTTIFYLATTQLTIWGRLYYFHKYLLSLCTFFGKSKIPHFMDFDFGHVTYFDKQNGREWDISHILRKNSKCSWVLCFGLSHFCSLHKERALSVGNTPLAKITDMWHQFNLHQQSGPEPPQLTYRTICGNCVLL